MNGSTEAALDACPGVSSAEASDLFSGRPYSGIGTLGADERVGAVPGHVDSVRAISDASSDNDLVRLRDCAPVTGSCSMSEGTSVVCEDGVDNDGDGYVDAADYDCWPALGLESEDSLGACTDDIDNDGDGHVDEVDFDCVPVLGL